PLERQLEAIERAGRNEIARATGVLAVARGNGDEPVLDTPARPGGVRPFVAPPAVERYAVEQQDPALALLLAAELVVAGTGGLGGSGAGGEGGEQGGGERR